MERVSKPDAKVEASDRELLERCRAGDETAFDDLVLRHQQRAFNVAFQLLRDHEDATEVAQDAFVRIYRSIGNFRGECEFTTWLHQIVVNLARNKHRWWKRRGRQAGMSLDSTVETADGEVSMQIAGNTDAPDVQAVKDEFVELLSRRMHELPRKFREVLVLRNVNNLSYEEIAEALDCSVGTVKSRIARAREVLRKSLKDEL
ncbi:MAG TPA: sigma-70 family RNA polymerase sigma factor [Verrucomicrobiae bacterium]|nr:sigma-70 family RNA polymerase sigma factor [Verrucomicrobiae bacterium]